jgi:DNA-binding NarL/FixJ family response regulator
VDDHPLVRDGLVRVLSRQKDLACCGQAGTAHETFAAVREHRPNLVILDLRLKNGDGLELIKSLKAQFPDLLILLLAVRRTDSASRSAWNIGILE